MNDSQASLNMEHNDERLAGPETPRLLIGVEVFCIAAMAIALYLINAHQPIDLPEIAQAMLTISGQ